MLVVENRNVQIDTKRVVPNWFLSFNLRTSTLNFYRQGVIMSDYEVEFWPGRIFQVKASSEEEALLQLLNQDEWLGGSESTSHGIHFQVWVRELKNPS